MYKRFIFIITGLFNQPTVTSKSKPFLCSDHVLCHGPDVLLLKKNYILLDRFFILTPCSTDFIEFEQSSHILIFIMRCSNAKQLRYFLLHPETILLLLIK